MSTSVQVLISGAYNRSTANDPGKLATDDELVLHVDRVYQRLWALVARARPDAFGSSADLSALSGTPPAVALPANTIDVVNLEDEDGGTVNLIPATERNRLWHVAPCMMRVGASLVSRNKSGDPGAGDVLTALLLDAPAALTSVSSVLDDRWPVRHDQLLVDYIACYLSVKDDGRSETEHNKLMGELKQDVSAFAAEFDLPPEAVQWIHSAVTRAKVPA
jgi:hypothetical protein